LIQAFGSKPSSANAAKSVMGAAFHCIAVSLFACSREQLLLFSPAAGDVRPAATFQLLRL
jgi:hypothetical protein